MPSAEKLLMLNELLEYEARTVYPQSLDMSTTTELKFEVSSTDLLYNLIEISRANRALLLAHFGYSSDNNLEWTPVSDT